MPSFLSLCLALLRLAIRTTNRVQGLLIDLHNTVEWVIEQHHSPRIPSTNEPSRSSTLSPSADTIDVVPSEHVTPSKSLATSIAEDVPSISALEASPSQTLTSTRVPIISSNNEVFRSSGAQSTFYKFKNTDKFSHPPVPEDDKIKEIEVTLKLYNKEPTTEPVLSVLSRREDGTLDSEDHSSDVTPGIIRQSNEESVVLQSTIYNSGTGAEDSHILKSNESKWREYRMMLKWYRDETVVPVPNKYGLDYEESTEQEPLDLSTNSETIGDAIYHEESNEPHSTLSLNLLETSKGEDVGKPIVSKPTPSIITPTKVGSNTTSELTSTTSTIDREVQSNIHEQITNQAYTESVESKDLRHKREEIERHEAKIHVSSEELETDVALEIKALPQSLTTSEPWLVTHKSTYDIDLKFEKNLHLKEYDTSTFREKGILKFSKSPIRDSVTGKHDVEPTKKTQSPVRRSPSGRKKSSTTPDKTNESTISPSLAVALSQSLSLPQFCVDSSTGNVQWKSDKLGRNVNSESKSPYKQSSISPITKKSALKSKTISETSIQNRNIPTEMTKTRNVYEPNFKISESETPTSEEEVQFKPTRERRPTPPPASFPNVISSTDSENKDSNAKSLSFFTEPIKMSTVDSEFKPVRERRPTPAARFSPIKFSDKVEKDDREGYELSMISRPNEASVVEDVEFKCTRERRLAAAAKFVDNESTTSSDNERDEKSNLPVSIPREIQKFKEKSPFKSQKKLNLTEVVLIKKSSPKRKIVDNDRPEQFYPSRNQSISTDERREFAFKPTRERRPTPAAQFPTPETTDSENSTQHALQSRNTESATNEPEPSPTCEPISSSVPGITISGSPTGKDDVSVVSKLAPRLRRKSSTSPSSSKSRVEAKTPPTVKFQIPESQAKGENTGTIRRESKLALRKSTKEISTSEEEYESKLAYKRKASPAKYPFIKSARMLTDAAAAARSLDFSPQKMSSEKAVQTQPLCEYNASNERVSLFKKAMKKEDTHAESVPGRSLLRELLTRSDIGVSKPRSSTFEGDSATKGEVHPYPHSPTKAPHNSPNYIKDTSTEMSASESTTGSTSDGQEEDSALEEETDVPIQPEGSRSLSDLENERFLRQFGIRFHYQGSTSSDSTTTESSIGYGSGGDSIPEGIAGLFPRGMPEYQIIVENVDTSGKDCPHPELKNCNSVTNVSNIGDAVETDSTSSKSAIETMYVEDSAPEDTEGLFPQLSDNESLIIAENVGYDSSGSDSASKPTSRETSPSGSCKEDSASENSKSVTYAENVDINAVLDSSSKSSLTVTASSHELEDSEPEGTVELFKHLKNIESPVNLENKDYLRTETHSLLIESSSKSSTGDKRSLGNPESEESFSHEATNESSRTTLSENTRLEVDSTSSESLKLVRSDDDWNSCTKMDFILSEAKSSDSLNSDRPLGDGSTRVEASDLGDLRRISTSSISAEKSKAEPSETDFPSLKYASSAKFIDRSSGDSELIKESGHYSQPETKLPKNSDDSDDSSSEADSKSSESTPSEKSSSDGYGDDSATGGTGGATGGMEQETCKYPAGAGVESKNEFNAGTNSASPGFTPNDTSNKQFEGNYENTADNCPQLETDTSLVYSRIPNTAETDFTSSDSARIKISENEDCKRDPLTEESPENTSQIETCESFSANFPDIRTEFEHAFLVIEESIGDNSQLKICESVSANYSVFCSEFDRADLVVEESTSNNLHLEIGESVGATYPDVCTEFDKSCIIVEESTGSNYPEIRSEYDQANLVVEELTSDNLQLEDGESASENYPDIRPEFNQPYLVVEVPSTDAESNSPERLSPIYEVSTNGTVSDVNNSDYENGYVVSTPSESSSEGEFILEQAAPYSPPVSLSPKNGESSSEAEATFPRVTSGESEYSNPVEPLAKSKDWPLSPICGSPGKGNQTSKTSDSGTLSSLSSPSISSNSEEERNNVRIKIETSSEPNSDISETCDVSTLSIDPKSKNMGEDEIVKDSICLQVNEYLEVTDCGSNVPSLLFQTAQRLTDYNILLLETLTQTQSQIIDTDFKGNSLAASFSLSNTEEKTLCDVSVDSNNSDETKILLTTQTQSVIPYVSTSIEIKNSPVSEQDSPAELSDTMVSENEICHSMLASVYSSAQQESSTEIELDNIIDVSEAEVCSIRESVVTEKVIENSSRACEGVCSNAITKELTTSQLLARNISILDHGMDAENRELTMPIETTKPLTVLDVANETCINMNNREQISQSQSQIVSNANEQIEMANSAVSFQSLVHHSKDNETSSSDTTDLEVPEKFVCLDKNDDGLIKCYNELASDSLPEEVSLNEDESEINNYSIETRLIDNEEPKISDNIEMEISVASELIISQEIPIKSLHKLDGLHLERIAFPLTLVKESLNVVHVDNENSSIFTESFNEDSLINNDSDKYSRGKESTRLFVCDATSIAESVKTKNDPNSLISSDILIDKQQTNLGNTEINVSALEEAIALETSVNNVLRKMQNETSNIPVVSNLIDEVSIRSKPSSCDSSESETGISYEAEYDEKVNSLNIETPAPSDGMFELEIEQVALKSTIFDLTACETRAETLLDDSVEKSESITVEVSTFVHGIISDCYDSRNTFDPKSLICDYSTNARSDEIRNNLNPEEKIDSESCSIEVSLEKVFPEFKDSNLPQLIISGIKSENDTGISNNIDSLNNIATELKVCDSSNDVAERIKSDDGTEFEVYIASQPVIFDIALGSTIKVLPSDIPNECPLDIDHIKVSDALPLASEFESCGKSVATEQGDDEQGSRTNFTCESVACDTPTNADIVEEISISIPSVTLTARDDPTSAEESKTNANLNASVPDVSETLICEVSKDDDIDNAVKESTSRTSSLEIEGGLDSAQSAEKMPEDIEEDSDTKVENKAWKKKSRKPKKKRKN